MKLNGLLLALFCLLLIYFFIFRIDFILCNTLFSVTCRHNGVGLAVKVLENSSSGVLGMFNFDINVNIDGDVRLKINSEF